MVLALIFIWGLWCRDLPLYYYCVVFCLYRVFPLKLAVLLVALREFLMLNCCCYWGTWSVEISITPIWFTPPLEFLKFLKASVADWACKFFILRTLFMFLAFLKEIGVEISRMGWCCYWIRLWLGFSLKITGMGTWCPACDSLIIYYGLSLERLCLVLPSLLLSWFEW